TPPRPLHSFPTRRSSDLPFVQTFHGNLREGGAVPPNNIFVSRDHARRYGSDVFVYNGLDPRDYIYRPGKGDYDLFLGRLHSIKRSEEHTSELQSLRHLVC